MTRLDPARIGWLADPRVQKVLAALKTDVPDTDARFVGGAVRNALLGRAVDDIDIATPLAPDAVMARLSMAGLKVVPTGLAHGTVTAVAGGRAFEITSLRRDIATDGRHAVVEFGGTWAEDAMRRDFTMNALYASADGVVFDFVGGLDDLRAKRVRFVGDPATRIREDYLRILRLFRFHAWYGAGDLDGAAFSSAAALSAGLTGLSGERIAKEMLKLLAAPAPGAVLRAMQSGGILPLVLAEDVDIARLERLAALDRRYGFAPDAVLRLAAVVVGGRLFDRWHVSKALVARLVAAKSLTGDACQGDACQGDAWHGDATHADARKAIFRYGAQAFRDQVFLGWAGCQDPTGAADARWFALLEQADLFEPPVFVINGHDAKALGLRGPAVGTALNAVRDWWIEKDFRPGRRELLDRLSALVKPAGVKPAGVKPAGVNPAG